jgi:dephospho-CoA kinase
LAKKPSHNLVVGFVGGIGSGKTAVANGLANHFQTLLINADHIGHEVLTFPTIKQQIRDHFGDGVFSNDEVNRKELAQRVFDPANFGESQTGTQSPDHQSQSPLEKLEQIVHPEIRKQIESQIEKFASDRSRSEDLNQTQKALVILDAPVMFEASWDHVCDFVVYLDTPIETRLARVAPRGWDADELRRRESNQWTLDKKREAADAIVDNSGSLDATVNRVKELINNSI